MGFEHRRPPGPGHITLPYRARQGTADFFLSVGGGRHRGHGVPAAGHGAALGRIHGVIGLHDELQLPVVDKRGR